MPMGTDCQAGVNAYDGPFGRAAEANRENDDMTNSDELIDCDPGASNSVFAIYDFENTTNGFILRWEIRWDRIHNVLKAASNDFND